MPADEATGRGDGSDVERYEQLRRRALHGDPSGWRAGLAVLQHHGVAAWLRAWRSLPAAAPSGPSQPHTGAPLPGDADRLVEGLASMALGCLAAGG